MKTHNKYFKTIVLSTVLLTSVNAIEKIKPNTGVVSTKVFREDCSGCQVLPISLDALVREVIKGNYDLTSQRMKVTIAKHQTEFEKGIFEPILNLSAGYFDTNVPNSAEEILSRGYLDVYNEDKYYAQAGIKGLTSSGAEWKIDISDGGKKSNLIDETQDYSREYDNTISLMLKQPLLKNFGSDVTEAKINIAKTNEVIVLNEYNSKLMNLVAATVKEYWTLYGTQKLYESWKNSLSVAKKGLAEVKLLVKHGKLPETEIIEVKSAILQRKTEILALRSKIVELQSRMMSMLNMSAIENPNLMFIVSDSPHIEKKVSIDSLAVNFDKALKNLPEYELTKLRMQQEEIKTAYNENQLLPDLSLDAGVRTAGLSSQASDALSDAFSGEHVSFNVGLSFEMPLFDNTQAEENLKISKMKLLDAKFEIESSKRMLNNVLHTKTEQLRTQQDRLSIYKNDMKLQSQLLNIEVEKLQSGKADVRDVFDYEEKVILSQRKLLNSIINWKLAEALLDKATGTLFEKYQIEVDTNNEDYRLIKDKLNSSLYN